MEIIIFLLQLIGWVVIILSILFAVTFVRIFVKELEKAKTERITDELNSTMLVYIEKINNTFLMYDSISNFFVAQGQDENELWENAKLRCPDMNLILGNVKIADGSITISTEKIKEQK